MLTRFSTPQRSASPSKFESQATGSPTKLTVPKRKARNQQSNRIHDIEFAAEISTSLIAQVRNLQSLLSERDEELKTLQGEKSQLEIDSENLQQRLKTLDESEHRYKEENWNLETRMQEMNTLQKEATDREKKLNLALTSATSEKSSAQKELDEVKASHAKLSEDHAAAVKHHDIELGTAKRSLAMTEEELATLQRKVDDLTSQNQELAKAYSTQRGRMLERDLGSGLSDEEFETATDNVTPEHSPPPSPVKGTPRHAVLETETMKTSLHHAQRTIQSQRSQLHREKTEKLELRRIIQDLRDDLEKARNDAGPGATRRSRKVESKEFKRPSKLLGSMRSGRHEILLDDAEWEDKENESPSGSPTTARRESVLPSTESSDHFDTANEASESAFETANERATATETDDFQTGNEVMSDSDGAETETETTSRGFGRMRRPPSLPAGLAKPGNRESFHSTASTSADEDVLPEVRTPTATMSSQKGRFRISRMFSRSSRQGSEEPNLRSSPSVAGSNDTPRAAGQSLFAELQDFEGSEDESVGGTPDRRLRSVTPGSVRRTASPLPPAMPPKPAMVDSSTMTEPVQVSAIGAEEEELKRPASTGSVLNTNRDSSDWRSSYATTADTDASRPLSTVSYSDAGAQSEEYMHRKLAQFPAPPTLPSWSDLNFTAIQTQHVEPLDPTPLTPPPLTLSNIISQGLEPVPVPRPLQPTLSLAPIVAETVDPVEEESSTPKALVPVAAEPTVPELSLSSILAQNILPSPERPPSLSFSGISTQQSTPVFDPLPSLPSLTLSSIIAEYTDPIEGSTPSTRLSLSSIMQESVEPRSGSRQRPPSLSFSAIQSVEVRPQSPRNWRDGFILPRDFEAPEVKDAPPETPNKNLLGALFGFGKSKESSPPVIAEDETRQSPSDSPNAETPESQRPFREISTNSSARPPRKGSVQMSDQGAQTSLTGGAIEQLVHRGTGTRKGLGHQKSNSIASVGSPDTIGTVKIHRSQESLASHLQSKGAGADDSMQDSGSVIVRPDSASSAQAPPLPHNHRQMIQAARTGSSSGAAQGTQGSMGPPLWPASAMKHRPSTPSHRPQSPDYSRGTPTPRAARTGGLIDNLAQKKHAIISRQSSMSSFASEIDTRFNMRPGEFDPTGFGPNTDPRMIQAITQTMIGEYLWKYTRKTGRGEMSDNRHRRYFWVHPYTRTLYWGERDPSSAGRTELKAKSVPIEAVRVVTDDNPMPPGLHRKSLVIISPGRTIKFTCPTGQRHETWFNALSYLLIRTEPQAVYDAEDVTGSITREDIDEFNPQYGRRPARGTRPEAASLSSYNSRASRNESPAHMMSLSVPTLTPTPHRKAAAERPSMSTLNKISGYWKMSSLRSRGGGNQAHLYEADQVHDSAEDLREMIEQQDRDADRLENVRACCDGKHDVGVVPHSGKRGRHSHGHPMSTQTTPSASARSRA